MCITEARSSTNSNVKSLLVITIKLYVWHVLYCCNFLCFDFRCESPFLGYIWLVPLWWHDKVFGTQDWLETLWWHFYILVFRTDMIGIQIKPKTSVQYIKLTVSQRFLTPHGFSLIYGQMLTMVRWALVAGRGIVSVCACLNDNLCWFSWYWLIFNKIVALLLGF